MMIVLRRNALLALALAWWACTGVHAETLTVPQLQRMLQGSAKAAVAFQEIRESPWLSTPVTSRGAMRSSANVLEKRVDSPRQETWRLMADRIEWVGPSASGTKQIFFTQAPALAALSQVMRRVVAGDLVALQADFDIKLSGDERVWSARLQPRAADVAKYLEQVELQGTGGYLQVIIVSERQGERTTTRLQH